VSAGRAAATVRLAAFEAPRTDELVRLWRSAFEFGVGVLDPHPLAEQRDYFMESVLPDHTVRVALEGDRMVGFVAARSDTVAQLHVAVDRHGLGIGTALLDWAKAQSGGSLFLYAFRRNLRACRFYERHGFRATAFGFEPTWKLDDVRYEWLRGVEAAG